MAFDRHSPIEFAATPEPDHSLRRLRDHAFFTASQYAAHAPRPMVEASCPLQPIVRPHALLSPARAFVALFAAAFFAALLPASPCRAAPQATAHVERRGETIVVDIETTYAGTVEEAWDVLTDYARMASFVRNIKSSVVVSRRGNSLVVRQSGETVVGFFHFGFAADRAVELTPMKEIDSALISGDFKSYVSTTRLVEGPSGVTIAYHGEYVPKSWLPPLIGPAIIESESRKQFSEYVDEMRRRQAASVQVH